MTTAGNDTLVLAYGNPGRRDDGLGPACAEALAGRLPPAVVVEADYQINIDAAATIAGCRRVVFVDAAVCGPEPFACTRIYPEPGLAFSSHSVAPQHVLALAETLFGGTPEAFALAIRGYEFDDFGEGLCRQAEENLAAAVAFLAEWLANPTATPTEVVAAQPGAPSLT
jgi:hydrogenase maturation protease